MKANWCSIECDINQELIQLFVKQEEFVCSLQQLRYINRFSSHFLSSFSIKKIFFQKAHQKAVTLKASIWSSKNALWWTANEKICYCFLPDHLLKHLNCKLQLNNILPSRLEASDRIFEFYYFQRTFQLSSTKSFW